MWHATGECLQRAMVTEAGPNSRYITLFYADFKMASKQKESKQKSIPIAQAAPNEYAALVRSVDNLIFVANQVSCLRNQSDAVRGEPGQSPAGPEYPEG